MTEHLCGLAADEEPDLRDEHGCGEVIRDGDEHWPSGEPYVSLVPFCPTCCDAAGFCEDPNQ